MKSYTDIEQSRKLAEILPIESADLFYNKSEDIKMPTNGQFGNKVFFKEYPENIPCWSLATLLDVMPEEVSLNSFKDGNWNAAITYPNGELIQNGKIICSNADNPVDACVELILKLHELKLL